MIAAAERQHDDGGNEKSNQLGWRFASTCAWKIDVTLQIFPPRAGYAEEEALFTRWFRIELHCGVSLRMRLLLVVVRVWFTVGDLEMGRADSVTYRGNFCTNVALMFKFFSDWSFYHTIFYTFLSPPWPSLFSLFLDSPLMQAILPEILSNDRLH